QPNANPANGMGNGASSSINVAGMPTTLVNAGNITVHVLIDHTWDADLDIYLFTPSGQRLRLSTDNGVDEDDYCTRFNSSASIAVNAWTPPFAGYLRPEGGMGAENNITPTITNFNALNGTNPNGTWTLRVFDDLSGDVGTVRFWSIDFPDETRVVTTTGVQDNYTGFVDIAIQPNSLSPSIVSTDDTLCPGGIGFYQAGPITGVTYQWSVYPQGNPAGAFHSDNDDSTTVVFPTTPGNYTVRLIVTSICCNNKDTTYYNVHIKNLVAPTINVSTNPICPGESTTLSVNVPGAQSIVWSTGALTSSITVSPTTTTNYTVNVVDKDGCALPQANATVTVKPEPTIASITGNNSVCSGQSVTLTATSNPMGATFQWSGLAMGMGSSITFTPTSDGYVVVTPTLNGCVGKPDSIYITVTLPPVGSITQKPAGAICAGQSVWLVASGGKSYEWSTAPGGPIISTDDSIFVTPATTTTYYIIPYFDGCPGPQVSHTVTVNPIPAAPTVNGATICSGNSTTLTATAPAGAQFDWYDAATGGNLINSGSSYPTPVLTSTTTYYVEAIVN
ncbi:MAG: proprotein convertase P-domain-containing protein, partial [Bacteroidia bacterium]|nr:proprotein convertase P-domain-containing protein [Bacteroidia bacterium]